MGHFDDESFQAVDYTVTDKQTTTKRKYTKHKNRITLRWINWP